MLTRRFFVASVVALPAVPVLAGSPPTTRLRLETAKLSLGADGPPSDALRLQAAPPGDPPLLLVGDEASVPFRNDTDRAVVMEWRGLHGIGKVGEAGPSVAPGQEVSLRMTPTNGGTVLLRAAPSSSHEAERGAMQLVSVPERDTPAVDRDLVLLLQDWLLAADNSLRFGSTPPGDAVRTVVTVNSATSPASLRMPPRSRVRLRIVNGSVQRLMLLTCEGARPSVVAIDGQPSDIFTPSRNTVPIGPGARYDLLLDLPDSAGATVRFTLRPTLTLPAGIESARDILILSTEGPPAEQRGLPTRPTPNPDLPDRIALEKARRADLVFAGQHGTAMAPPMHWTVNGIPGPAFDKPLLTVRRGDAVVLGLSNASTALVPLRFAGQSVRLLHARDDGWEPYWRDTLLLPPGGRSHVAFVADRDGRWPIDSGYDDLTLAGLSCCFDVTPR